MDQTSATREDPGDAHDRQYADQHAGGHYRDRLQDFDRLRRSSTDRYLAGVCGGLGRHFGIDPTLIRILLAVMCLFGGTGLLFYAAVWAFVPSDDRADAPVHVDGEARRVLVLVAAALAVVGLVGTSWGGFWWSGGWGVGWPLCLAALVAVIVLGRRRHTPQPPAPDPGPAAPEHPAAPGGAGAPGGLEAPRPPYGVGHGPAPVVEEDQQGPSRSHDTVGFEAVPAEPGDEASRRARKTAARPPSERRPRRTGLILFWPAVALVLLGWGVLGLYDIDHHVAAAAWPALGLAVTGLMLLVGAFWGRPGGLILLGCLLALALSVTAIADTVQWESDRTFAPATSSQVSDSYAIGNGRMVVDLADTLRPAQLDGRRIEAHLGAGEVVVILPPDVAADVDADITLAGSIDLGTRNQDGLGPSLQRRVGPSDARATIDLRVWANVGHIEVRNAPASALAEGAVR